MPEAYDESVTVPTVVPLIAAEIVWPLNVSARCCQVPVPGAVTVPLASVVSPPLLLFRTIDQAPVLLQLQVVVVDVGRAERVLGTDPAEQLHRARLRTSARPRTRCSWPSSGCRRSCTGVALLSHSIG